MKKILFALIGGAVLSVVGCATNGGVASGNNLPYVTDAKIIVSPLDWGPAVDKILLEMSGEVSAEYIEKAGFPKVVTNGSEREVIGVRLASNDGEEDKKAKSSAYVIVSLKNPFVNYLGFPFHYDTKKLQSEWASSFPVKVQFEKFGGIETDCINNRICKATDVFSEQKEISGTYENPLTKASENITLRYKAYEPNSLKNDGKKNPLVIWLHGQGEGGKDVDVAILGNKVSALTTKKIQSYFTTEGGESGAYVLVPQCETYWMDGGDGTNSCGDVVSRYTKALYDLICAYLKENSDVDEKRIYLGGCSNGGYMTVNMLVEYPNFFAAAYPNCEAYAFNEYERDANGKYVFENKGLKLTGKRFMTEEKIEKIKNIPIWFVHSADDGVVVPEGHSIPTYRELVKAGAKNVHYSYFENVINHEYSGVENEPKTYWGHWVWVYLFNDEVSAVQDVNNFVATNAGGGTLKAHDDKGEYTSIFAWLNAQSK